MTVLDSEGIRNLRLSRGIAQRQLANAAGVDIATIRRLETTGLSDTSTFSVAQLVRIADHLNVDINHLFKTSKDEPACRTALEDTQLLGATLLDLGKSTKTKAVSEVLGWDSTKVHHVADNLDTLLKPTGMTLRHTKGVLRLCPLDDRHQDHTDELRKHPLARVSQRVVTSHRAKLIYAMEAKPVSNHSATEDSLMGLAILYRFKMVTQDGHGNFIVADDVLHSLYPEGFNREDLTAARGAHPDLLPGG